MAVVVERFGRQPQRVAECHRVRRRRHRDRTHHLCHRHRRRTGHRLRCCHDGRRTLRRCRYQARRVYHGDRRIPARPRHRRTCNNRVSVGVQNPARQAHRVPDGGKRHCVGRNPHGRDPLRYRHRCHRRDRPCRRRDRRHAVRRRRHESGAIHRRHRRGAAGPRHRRRGHGLAVLVPHCGHQLHRRPQRRQLGRRQRHGHGRRARRIGFGG